MGVCNEWNLMISYTKFKQIPIKPIKNYRVCTQTDRHMQYEERSLELCLKHCKIGNQYNKIQT